MEAPRRRLLPLTPPVSPLAVSPVGERVPLTAPGPVGQCGAGHGVGVWGLCTGQGHQVGGIGAARAWGPETGPGCGWGRPLAAAMASCPGGRGRTARCLGNVTPVVPWWPACWPLA